MVYAIECCHADDDDSDDVDSKYDDDSDDDDNAEDDVDSKYDDDKEWWKKDECITSEFMSHQCKGAYWRDISPLTWRVVLVQYRYWKLLYHDEYAVLL